MRFLRSIHIMLLGLICLSPNFNGIFDSRGGSYDYQTGWKYDAQYWFEITKQTFFSKFRSSTAMNETAGGKGHNLASAALFQRKKITMGDEVQFTSNEAIHGLPTYGDQAVQRGQLPGYKNMIARTNLIKSPAIPLPGEMSQQRAEFSIKNIPAQTRTNITNYMSDELEYQVLYTIFNGASPAVLAPTSIGGLGASLGIGSGHTSSVPLMCKNWFTNDGGFLTYSNTHATWNSTVNDAINACTQTADELTLNALRRIRSELDKRPWNGATVKGKRYKSVVACDPDLWYRLDSLLDSRYQAVGVRGKNNETYKVDYEIEFNGCLFVNVPNMEIFRPSYSAALARPLFGPTFLEDPRTYTNSSNVACMVFMGDNVIYEGYNGSIRFTDDKGYHGDGAEIAARTNVGYMRGEWYAKDGRTTADQVYSPSIAIAAFYETGVAA